MKKRTIVGMSLLLMSFHSMAKSGYHRDPDLHDNQVVFTAEGDLWLHDMESAATRRLTTNLAQEQQAAFSSDGTQIAFTANYEGATEVYVIPTEGGVARRVTFENSYVYLQQWTSDGKLLYSTNTRVGPANNWSLKQVDPATLNTEEVPVADAIEGAIDEASDTLYFTQFGLQVSRDNARYYRGGAQGELWRYKLGSQTEALLLTDAHDASAREPMVTGDKLYFVSNQNGNDNLWVMSASGKNAKALRKMRISPRCEIIAA